MRIRFGLVFVLAIAMTSFHLNAQSSGEKSSPTKSLRPKPRPNSLNQKSKTETANPDSIMKKSPRPVSRDYKKMEDSSSLAKEAKCDIWKSDQDNKILLSQDDFVDINTGSLDCKGLKRSKLRKSAFLCLACNVFFEARGEGTFGMKTIAEVTLNRADLKMDNVCDSVFMEDQFSWANEDAGTPPAIVDVKSWRSKGKMDEVKAWEEAQAVALAALSHKVDNLGRFQVPEESSILRCYTHYLTIDKFKAVNSSHWAKKYFKASKDDPPHRAPLCIGGHLFMVPPRDEADNYMNACIRQSARIEAADVETFTSRSRFYRHCLGRASTPAELPLKETSKEFPCDLNDLKSAQSAQKSKASIRPGGSIEPTPPAETAD